MRCIDKDGQPIVWIKPQETTASGILVTNYAARGRPKAFFKRSVLAVPLTYEHVGTSFKAQARASKNTHIYVQRLKEETNQLYTLVSRAIGSLWKGTLKIEGFAGSVNSEKFRADVSKKMKMYPKSLLLMHLFGLKVDAEKIAARRARVLVEDPGWVQVEHALRGRLL